MTRTEFLSEVTTWSDLMDWVNDAGLDDMCNDVYYADDLDDIIEEDVSDFLNYNDWKNLAGMLRDVENVLVYASYVIRNGTLDYADADEFFEDYKSDILDCCDQKNLWDADENEELEDETTILISDMLMSDETF